MVKICWQMLVYNGNFVLEECLKTILPYGKVVVTEGPVSYFAKNGKTTSDDGTNEVLSRLVGDENIVHGVWDEKDSMQNAVLHLIPKDTNFVWLVDSDEIYFPEDIESIIGLLLTDKYDSVAFKANSFYAGFSRRMTGFEENFEIHRIQRWYPGARWKTHRPPTVLAPDGKPWREHRHLSHSDTDKMGIRIAHYSYVWPSQMRMKIPYYRELTNHGTIEGYFDTVYRKWILGDDAAKQAIENQFSGVHDWRPERRGDCYTVPFTGEHPEEIKKSLPKLQERLDKEIAELL